MTARSDLLASIGLILFSVVCGVTGQTVIKMGVTRMAAGMETTGPAFLLVAFRSPLVWLGLVLYGVSALAWILVLSRLPLSLAYPFLALNFVLIALSARIFLGESIPLLRWGGIGLLVMGILLVAKSAV